MKTSNMKIIYNEETITVEVRRSSRKTAAISITPQGSVIVKVPAYLSDKAVKDMVLKRTGWIWENLKKISVEKTTKKWTTGEEFHFIGEKYKLKIILNPNIRKQYIAISDGNINVFTADASESHIKTMLKEWYIQNAKKQIENKVSYYAGILGENYNSIKIKQQKSRWGSCSTKRNLNFNWQLIMAPEAVMDYVVIHELCHLKHMNHSCEFWKEVEKVMPDYARYKNWLKENGRTIEWNNYI